ncbi:hypothetical protein Leryth_011176 [Lithospermum erythrorhizon]|nr:hypothetical protein Leryth_011176 [Lithospermum erythrorhizon]
MLCIKDQALTSEEVEKIIGWTHYHHFKNNSDTSDKESKPLISCESIRYGLSMLQSIQNEPKSAKTSLKDVVTENAFETSLLNEVIASSEIGVTFGDIGDIGECEGYIKNCYLCRLLAKDNWQSGFGEAESYLRLYFLPTLNCPQNGLCCEVDSMLGRRGNPGEDETMSKIKNEFMLNWDGLRTKDKERVLEALALNIDLQEVANMIDGFSGSDLKNFCVPAAHCPIREILEKEKQTLALEENKPLPSLYSSADVHPLRLEDLSMLMNRYVIT